jgi:hypothetical protein
MAMLVVPDSEFDKELKRLGLYDHSKDFVNPVPSISQDEIVVEDASHESNIETAIIEQIQRGRSIGAKEVPQEVRQFIAEESLNGTPAKQLSELTGISESSISAYKVGATSTASYDTPVEDLRNHVDKVKIAISNKARGRLIQAIDSLTNDKISGAKAKEIASIAKDMSAVVKNLERETEADNLAKVQFVFFAPKVKSEAYFPIIEVND